MPISPADGEREAQAIRRIYADAERTIVAKVSRRIERGIDREGWAEAKLAELRHVRRDVEREIRQLRHSDGEVERIITSAYKSGSDSAVEDLRKADSPGTIRTAWTATNRQAVERLAQATVGNLNAAHFRILRVAEDAYRRVIAEASVPQVLTGVMTRREAAQRALNRFADLGITGYVDRAGRSWDIASYSEMATRTGAGQAAVQGHIDRLVDNGKDLVIVSDSPDECDLCRPWEGRVLSLTGQTPGHPAVDEARAAGLFHPNCTHRLGAFIPGLTRPMSRTASPERYEDRQRQRQIERKIRKWKLREVAAITDDDKRFARAKVAEWQAEMRGFIGSTGRIRTRAREQVGKAR